MEYIIFNMILELFFFILLIIISCYILYKLIKCNENYENKKFNIRREHHFEKEDWVDLFFNKSREREVLHRKYCYPLKSCCTRYSEEWPPKSYIMNSNMIGSVPSMATRL